MPDTIRRLSDELARDPSSLAFMPLADALRRAGQLELAMRVALRGLDRHPYVADAHDVLARILVDRGDLQRAADEWEMALRLDPAHSAARKGLGFIDYRRGDLESAERRLTGAGDAGDIASALAHVRSARSAREAPPAAPPEFPRATVRGARALFAPVLDGADQAALLVDEDGLVLAGSYISASGEDVAEMIGAELAGVSGEAERAMRHLALGAWTSVLVEADSAAVAMTPAPRGSLLVVAASRETPVGLVRLLLDRARDRACDWLARLS